MWGIFVFDSLNFSFNIKVQILILHEPYNFNFYDYGSVWSIYDFRSIWEQKKICMEQNTLIGTDSISPYRVVQFTFQNYLSTNNKYLEEMYYKYNYTKYIIEVPFKTPPLPIYSSRIEDFFYNFLSVPSLFTSFPLFLQDPLWEARKGLGVNLEIIVKRYWQELRKGS